MILIEEHQILPLVKAVYNMSSPVGMGFLHYTPEDMTTEEADNVIRTDAADCVASMDYVKGRQCKFSIFKVGYKFAVADSWDDHSKWEYAILLNSVGIPLPQHLQGDLTHAD